MKDFDINKDHVSRLIRSFSLCQVEETSYIFYILYLIISFSNSCILTVIGDLRSSDCRWQVVLTVSFWTLMSSGKVFVHCAMGVSRSGALVLAYLMICQGLSLTEAIIAVRLNRDIGPNAGFLGQLVELELSLRRQGRRVTEEDCTHALS